MMQLDGTWRRADTNGLYHGSVEIGSKTHASNGLRVVQDRSHAVLSLRSRLRHAAKPGLNLRGWKPNDTWQKAATETLTDWKNWDALALLLFETAARNDGDQGDDSDRTGLERAAEQTLPRWRKRRALKRENHLSHQDQGVCRDGERKTHSKHFNWSSIAK